MPEPLLATKVSVPLMRQVLVPRRKLLRRLSEGVQDGHLLSLISAPAGYGKTTAIRMWVAEAGYPVAWLTLEASDNQLKQFLTYFLTALGRAEEELGHAALELLDSAQEIDLPRVLGLLINDLHQLERTILFVLEEYQLIENPQIDQFLEAILQQALPTLHLVIATREDPSLPLTRLRVRNQLTEIRALDLSFSREETGDFFAHVMRVNLSDAEVEVLRNRTEGWVAGLQLAALSLKESGDHARQVEAFRGTHRHVLDYLIEEVLKNQPPAVQMFLRRTAILDQLTPSLCEALTGQSDAAELLHYLETNNLFLLSLDEERRWYRYHALFAELLRNQLLQVEPERVDDLHERAAAWYQQNGFIQKAVEHAFQIANGRMAAQLVEQHAIPMLYQGEVSIVAGWFNRLSALPLQASAMLCISRAWSLALLHPTQRAEVEAALQAAELALTRTPADEAQRNLIAGHSASIQAYLMQSPSMPGEQPAKLIETSLRAQHLLPEAEKAIRSVNDLNIAYGHLTLGDLPAAEGAYRQASDDGIAGGNYYAAIYGQIDLIVIAMLKGRLKDAAQLCQSSIARFNRLLAGQRFPPIGDLYGLRGILLLEANRPAEAEQALTHALSLVRLTTEAEAHVRCYTAWARLRALQGDWAGTWESVKLLEESAPAVAAYAGALRHRLALRDPAAPPLRLIEARDWMTQSGLDFGSLPAVDRLDLVGRLRFDTHLSTAYCLIRLAAQNRSAYPLSDAHDHFARQEAFARAHGLSGWLIEMQLARALMYHVSANSDGALRMLQAALNAAAAHGYFRIFLDEADLTRPILKALEPQLRGDELPAFVKRLLEAMPEVPAERATQPPGDEALSDRELDVLRLLAAGQTYKEIGRELFLSLNTVQFHVKNIYGKLLVNKRVQAIEKARQMRLI